MDITLKLVGKVDAEEVARHRRHLEPRLLALERAWELVDRWRALLTGGLHVPARGQLARNGVAVRGGVGDGSIGGSGGDGGGGGGDR